MKRLAGLWRAFRPTMLLTAIPFALLVNSAQVHMSLQIEGDGTARRLISVEAAPYFKGEVGRYVGDVQTGRRWDRTWRGSNGTTYSYSADYRTQALNQQSANAHLTIEDVAQNPLSLYTTYTWQEEVTFGYLYATDPGMAAAADEQVVYKLRMPGPVVDATVEETRGKPGESQEDKPVALKPRDAKPAVVVAPLFVSPADAQEMPAAAPAAPAPAAPAPPSSAPVAPAAPGAGPMPEAAPLAGATPGAEAPVAPPTDAAAPAATPGATPAPEATPAPTSEATPDGGAATPQPPADSGPVAPKATRSSVEKEGNTATFKLMASQPSVTINVVAKRLRLGYLIIVLYVLAFVGYQLFEGLQAAARRRPRKI